MSRSLSELTRNCFQSGISPKKWLALCKQLVAERSVTEGPDIVATEVSNSVLFLYRSYPGDPILNAYLLQATKDGILPLPIFVSTFLSASRSTDLHSAATLDFLCELALKTHEESGRLPLGSLVSTAESPISLLETVQDALALVQVSHTMSLNQHHHKLSLNSEKLLFHLLSCVTDVSPMTGNQAFLMYTTVSDILRDFQLDSQIRQVLGNFAINLGILIGDDAKIAREAQMMQSLQTSKSTTGGLNSETDVITLGLLWQYLITHRGHEFGAGNTQAVVALLVSAWRWSSWPAHVFYMQAFVSVFTCLASGPNLGYALLWKAFIVGRLPSLLSAFEKVVSADQSASIDWRSCLRKGLRAAFRRQDLIASGDLLISRATGSNEGTSTQSFARKLLEQLLKTNLIDQSLVQELDPLGPAGTATQADSTDRADLTAEFDTRMNHGLEDAEVIAWLDKIWKEPDSHVKFMAAVMKRFSTSSKSLDVEALSRLCKWMYTQPSIMDLVSLHARISDLVFYALLFLEEYDCETVGDPQTAASHIGDIVLFLQYVLTRFQLEDETFTKDNRTLNTEFLRCTDVVLPVESLQAAEASAFHSWLKALFDSNSEGIEDSILRATHPKLLLRISATLFSQAIKAASAHKIDSETLMNGVLYFTKPLLNWTLVGVIKALIDELELAQNPHGITLDILQSLLSSCPPLVRALCSTQVLRYLADNRSVLANRQTFDIATIEDLIRGASNRTGNTQINSAILWSQYPQNQIHAALSMARNNKIVDLDVDRWLKILNPTRLLPLLWPNLARAAGLGDFEVCRRVTTFILTMPRNSKVPPLLPIFMHLFLPSLLDAMDKAQGSAIAELTASIIVSTLTAAFHLEWSMNTVLKDNRLILGARSSAMAKRLAHDLRSRKSGSASSLVLQQLSSNQAFVANFPYFGGELTS
ncbi:hypothetical protein FA15DRAFT_662476 [Coprinopsis marcescibilis]|uniref:Mediator of RNA polymerase II transcription subunit 5 n=1 Tax=Coprinopsis marcescibilis TaxID=230819 RepID=A0A5C3LCZ3_COPMA|nr:hypothetical protein FA15DRAFT_662476 [Coprinopsis marcescibilis]